jgi:thiol-disulfide isomerase/thioredoxin
VNHALRIVIGIAFCHAANADDVVAPGGAAPNLDVRWIQGGPIERFETGRVYVLEFWSTWCGACTESISKLNALSQKHERDARFIALHVWQQPTAAKPEEFLQKRASAGQPIYEFPVAEDVNEVIARTWLAATEITGLPTAMILDRQSRLVWFGHSKGLEQPLTQIIAGTYDVAAGTAEMNRRIRAGRLARQSTAAIEAGDFDRGTALMIEALSADPDSVAEWVPSTYGHLLATSRNPAIAARFVDQVSATPAGTRAEVLAGFADVILHFQPAELRDLALAATLAERANRLTGGRDAGILHTLAMVRLEQEDFSGARQALKQAVAAAHDERTRKRLMNALEEVDARTP